MSSNRVIYQNWIVEMGRDPDHPVEGEKQAGTAKVESLDDLVRALTTDDRADEQAAGNNRAGEIASAVASALRKLTDDEREFVERFYFMGQSYREISDLSGRALHKLESLHKRAFRRLRRELAPIALRLFGVRGESRRAACVICDSPVREEIDRLIQNKPPDQTWKPLMQEIKHRYGLTIKTPQILIGHSRYH